MEAFIAVAYVSAAAATVPYFTVMGMCAVVIGAVLYVPVYVLHAAELEESRRRPRSRSSSPPPLRFGSSSSTTLSQGLSHNTHHCHSLKDTASTGIGSSTASYRSNSELSPILKSHSNDFFSDNHDRLILSNLPPTLMESREYLNEVVQSRRRSGSSSALSSSSLYLYSPRLKPQPPQLISRPRQDSRLSFSHDFSDDQTNHVSDGMNNTMRRRNRIEEDESDADNHSDDALSEDVIAALQRGDGPFFFQL